MNRFRLVARFVALTCLLVWILLVPLSSLGKVYGAGMRSMADFAVRGMTSHYDIRVKATSAAHGTDSAIVIRPPGRRPTRRPFSSRNRGYLPTICGIALALATPIPWRRRVRAALLTALITQGFVAGRLALAIVQMLQDNPRLNSELPSLLSTPAMHQFFQRLTSLEREATLFFLVPFGIWAVVSLRMDDIERLWYGDRSKVQALAKMDSAPAAESTDR